MDTKTKRTSLNIGLMALMGLVGILAVGTMGVQASVVSDIPEKINIALLGGTSLYAAKAILTASMMMACGLTLGMLRVPPAGLFIALLTVLGALTAIGWADLTFLALAAFMTVAMFGKTMAGWVTGTGDSGG